MTVLREVQIQAEPLERFAEVIGQDRTDELVSAARDARSALERRTIWNVNSTAAGGGVAEMLSVLLAYARGAGIDARWLVVNGEPGFWTVTKRLHNWLHGSEGDGRPLDGDARSVYEETTAANATQLAAIVRPGDVILLHDPQTAGMLPHLAATGTHVLWRCHIGTDDPDEHVDGAWEFLQPYLEGAAGYVFSRAGHVPSWVPDARVAVVPPSIDPFAPKNQDMTPGVVRGILGQIGMLAGDGADAVFARRDGSRSHVRRTGDFVRSGRLPAVEDPLVVQVSRWDRLKDMEGVLRGFADHVPAPAHLALVGPAAAGVSDDPEAQAVLESCQAIWDDMPRQAQERAHLVALPMDDVDENAAMVNAFQRHATVMVQKSLQEGFGLTVTEAMYKARPTVASRIGGIQDQIEHGTHGLLLDDPTDLATFGHTVADLLADPDRAAMLGRAARERVVDEFVGDRHLRQYAELLSDLVS